MSVLRYVQRTREPLVVGDATGDDRFARDPYFAGITCCSLLAVPILSRGALRAVLLLENRLIRAAFTTGRLDAVNLIAGQLAVSLDNAQLYAEYRRIAGEQAALRRVATLVAQAAPPQEVFAAVAEEVRPAAGGRLRGPGPLRPAGHAGGRRHVDQHGRASADPGRRAGAARRAERHHAGVADGPAGPDRLRRRPSRA